jgi:hypothetical protein
MIEVENIDENTQEILKENYLELLEINKISSRTPAVKNIVNLFLDSNLSDRKKEVFIDYAQDMIINRFNKEGKEVSSMLALYSDLSGLKNEIIGK